MNKQEDSQQVKNNKQFESWEGAKLYYVLALGKCYLMDPISWIERPSTMPKCIKDLNATPVVLLYYAHQTFFTCVNTILEQEEISKDTIAKFDQVLQDPERPIEIIRNNLSMGTTNGIVFNYSSNGYEIKDTNKIERQERQKSFAKTKTEAIQKMLNDLRYYSLLALGIRTTNSIVYDDHEKDIRNLEKRMKQVEERLNDYNVLPEHLKALIGSGDDESLIVYKNKPEGGYYIYNKNFRDKHPHRWYKEALKRFEFKGLLESLNWEQLAKYIRKGDGTQYAQLSKEVKTW